MLTATFLVKTLIDIYVMILLMRVWMQWARCDFYNPFSQFIVKASQPIIQPLRRVIPSIGPIDTASVLVAYLLLTIKMPILVVVNGLPLQFTPFFFILGLAGLLKAAGMLLFYVLLIRAIMSWISRGQGLMDYVLYQLTEPLMAPLRRVIPAFGGLDFSVMIIILVLYLLNFAGLDMLGTYWQML